MSNKLSNLTIKLVWIQSKDWINFDPVLGQDQYTSSGIQYYHVSKIKQYGWLIYSWIINEFEIYSSMGRTSLKMMRVHSETRELQFSSSFDRGALDLVVDHVRYLAWKDLPYYLRKSTYCSQCSCSQYWIIWLPEFPGQAMVYPLCSVWTKRLASRFVMQYSPKHSTQIVCLLSQGNTSITFLNNKRNMNW